MIPSLADEPEACGQISTAIRVIGDVLGEAVCAACLYGSAVSGGLRPDSDLDILVVSGRSLTREERAAIVRGLLPISGRHRAGGPRPLEVSIVARPAVAPWRYPPSIELQYGEWMRAEFERGELPVWPKPDADVTVLIKLARDAGVPLLGLPLADVLEPPPQADLVRAMRDAVPVLMPGIEESDDIRNGLLTLARIWVTVSTGEIRSKDEAANWALARLPEEHRAVLAHARAAYRGEAPEDWRTLSPRLRPHVDYVVARISELASRQTSDARDQGSFDIMDRKTAAKDGTETDSPSRLIDARIRQLGDWRGETLARVRALIREADPEADLRQGRGAGRPVRPLQFQPRRQCQARH